MNPDVLQFSDYRSFLKAVCEVRKTTQKHFSLAQWARQLQLKSSSTLIMILNGSRNPSATLVEELIQNLKLNLEQGDHFRNLVTLEKAKTNPHLRALLLEQLSFIERPNLQLKQLKFLRLMSRWSFTAIRELVNLPDFQEDVEWIQSKLRFHVPRAEITEALETLVSCEWLERDENGKLKYSSNATTTFDVPDDNIKRFHQSALDVMKDAVDRVPVQERELLNMTFSCKKEKLPLLKKRIREILNDLGEITEGDADTVFMMQIGCVPLTQETDEEKRDK